MKPHCLASGALFLLAYLCVSCIQAPVSTPAVEPQRTVIGMPSKRVVGEQKTITVLVDFADVHHSVHREKIHDKVFLALNSYLKEMSYSRMWLTGDTTEWYRLPHPVSHYAISSYNKKVDRKKVRSLVIDALNAADQDIDFSQYAHVMIILGASPYVYGMGGFCAIPGFLGNDMEKGIKTKTGEIVHGVSVGCWNAPLGVYIHDLLHVLGGVIENRRVAPCLYDHHLQSTPGNFRRGQQFYLIYMGWWDPMSCHINELGIPRHLWRYGLPTPGLSSWTKLRLGWIQSSTVTVVHPGQFASIIINPLELTSTDTLVIRIPLTSEIYYLIENRQKISSDESLPSSGVLVLYADDSVDECRWDSLSAPRSPVKIMDANPNKPRLLDAAFDIGKTDSFIDSRNNFAVILLQKIDLSYELHFTISDKAAIAANTWAFLKRIKQDMDKAFIDGKTTRMNKAEKLFNQAKAAFDKGAYDNAERLGQQAKALLLDQ